MKYNPILKHMKTCFRAVCLLLCLLVGTACAEYYDGKTVALETHYITSECAARIESMLMQKGSTVAADQLLFRFAPNNVFSTVDGTVASVNGEVGQKVSGSVLKIAPSYLYLIYCSTDSAYEAPENDMIHNGESLYIRCTKNGSHRAMGIVKQLDGNEFQLEATAGALYIGETVYLYRSSGFSYASRVGIGTVVSAEAVSFDIEGNITEMKVSAGDSVEKGQLLFRYMPEGDGNVLSPFEGIISETYVTQGDEVQENAKLAALVRYEDIGIEINISESDAGKIQKDQRFAYTLSCDPEGEKHMATVSMVRSLQSDGGYTVLLKPDEAIPYLGMSAQVQIEY